MASPNVVQNTSTSDFQFLEDVTTNPDEIQNQVLSEILSCNAHVEYLQRHGLDGRTDPATFKKVVPVITYEDIKPEINRIAYGDTSQILCGQPISAFLYSSGTSTGESKLIPITEEALGRVGMVNKLLKSVMNKYVPGLDQGKGMNLIFIRPETKTPGGLVVRSALTHYMIKSSQSKALTFQQNYYTSPIETILCVDSYQSMYSQLLCGLYQNNHVIYVGSFFASGFIRSIRFLQKHWNLLCKDIQTGTIDTQITDQSVREAVLKILKPNPKLAEFIKTECSKESWQGIISRLWPNTKFIDVIITGTMSQYISILDYYSNGLPIVCTRYASSECIFGLNLEPLSKPNVVSYMLVPTMAYFEFLPVDRNNGVINSVSSSVPNSLNEKEHHELVDLVDVKLGKEYELVVTTYAGLYRYRMGDVLRVAGFKNRTPKFNFICRKNVVLNIDSTKTNEVELQNAVNNSINHLLPFDASLEDYTSYVDTSTMPGHYVLFWELRHDHGTSIPQSVFEDCCLTIEESLSSEYRQGRVFEKSIGPLEIKIVEAGTFDKLMDDAINRGASINQYKTPRCVKFAPIIELLNSRVLSNYFSLTCPKWVPGHQEWYDDDQN